MSTPMVAAQCTARFGWREPLRIAMMVLVLALTIADFNCPALCRADQQPAAIPIDIVDGAGQSVHLASPPQRIVVVGRAPFITLNMLYMFPEARRRLVGYERKVENDEAFLPLVDLGYHAKTPLAANPGPEHVAALKPDLVLIKGNSVGALEKALAGIHIPVVHLDLENPEQFLKAVDLLGQVFNNPQRALQIRSYYQSRLDLVTAALKNLRPDQQPRTLIIKYGDRMGDTAMLVPGSSWIQTLQVGMAGGNPVWVDQLTASQSWQVVGFEQIAAWNPDILLTVVWHRLEGCPVIRNLGSDPKWGQLKAVDGHRFFLFPEDIYGWDTPDPRWVLGLLWMATKIHPQRFAQVDMQAEVRCFFTHLYGMDNPTIDTHLLARVALDDCR